MRDYAKVSPQFWIGKTGKSLRGNTDAQLLALYLMTSPHANMIGVFYCPVAYMTHETGITLEGASKALQSLIEGGFCTYDTDADFVWVHEMAKFQIGDELSEKDNQVKGIQKQYDMLPQGIVRKGFFDKYKDAFHIVDASQKQKPLARASKAPAKPGTGTGDRTGTGDDCAESQSASTPSGILIPLVNGSDFEIPMESIAEWRTAYPAVDVEQQLKAVRVWCLSNPTKRKTSSGVGRFINAWLAKEQDKPRGRSFAEPNHAYGNGVAL